MDERRVLIAFGLVFAVLFAFNFYATKHAAPVLEGGAEVSGGAQVTEVEGGAERSTADGGAARAAREAVARPGVASEDASAGTTRAGGPGESRLVVETPLWVATLSSRGGSVSSWLLTEYVGGSGSPIELVREGARGLETEIRAGATRLATDDWLFSGSDTGRVVLGASSPPRSVRYEATTGEGVRVVKEYTFSPGRYSFDVAVSVGGLGQPGPEKELWIGWPGVLATEEKEDASALASVALVDGKAVRSNVGSLKKTEAKRLVGEIRWATSQSRYFMAAVIPQGATFETVEAYADSAGTAAGFRGALAVAGDGASFTMRVFAGPQDYRLISELGVGLERAIDLGWSLLRPLSAWVLKAFVWCYRIIPNYGVVIIVFSILTKLLFYRLTHKSFAEMKRMQDLQPRLEELKAKHKDNREQLARAQMQLYKQAGVNPLGGCLPMLLQMPVFIVLYQVLRTTIELRGAPFALWMKDLSQPELLVQLGPIPVRLLPLLMGVGMFVQQRMSTKDPSQALVGNLMPIIFTFLFYNLASGLVLYWLVNTVLSVAQQYYIHRGLAAAPTVADATAPTGVSSQASSSSVTRAPAFEADAATPAAGSTAGAAVRDRGGPGRSRRRKKR